MPVFVPLHSIIVMRDDKQVDALTEYKATGKAFDFTDKEIDELTAIAKDSGNDITYSLREPNEEGPVPGPAEVMSAGTDTAPVAGKKVAEPVKAVDDKDVDL